MSPRATASAAAKARLRLWIRMLRLTRAIESELRENLRTEFSATLPRFDVMAALYRFPRGMILSELSRYLMVSNGNVTGIVNRLGVRRPGRACAPWRRPSHHRRASLGARDGELRVDGARARILGERYLRESDSRGSGNAGGTAQADHPLPEGRSVNERTRTPQPGRRVRVPAAAGVAGPTIEESGGQAR